MGVHPTIQILTEGRASHDNVSLILLTTKYSTTDWRGLKSIVIPDRKGTRVSPLHSVEYQTHNAAGSGTCLIFTRCLRK